MPHRELAGHFRVRDGVILWADEDAHFLLGYSPGALADTPFADVFAQTPRSKGGGIEVPARGVVERFGAALQSHGAQALTADLRGERMDDGSTLWIFRPAARGLRSSRLDVLSRRDTLTRLSNRIPTVDELGLTLHGRGRGKAQWLAVCFLDIDRFRDVNERFGPAGGDTVLREVARRIRAGLPPGASAARVGSDEFALVLFPASEAQCRELLQQIVARLDHPFRVGDKTARLRVSIGVTLTRFGEHPTDVMQQHAQEAVFFAKRAGGDQFHFFDAAGAFDTRRQLEARRRVRKGLLQHEFVLAYQPKVDMRRGTVVGFEALVRWNHPRRGLLQPDAFIPLIEDDELVEQLGDWAIGEALRQMVAWREQGVDTCVSVNVSPRDLVRPDFVARVSAHLARHPELPPDVLELEILETTAIKDFAAVARLIEQCGAIGVKVTMDDFGTGYSSLTYLRELPVSAVKLDRSFVRGILHDAGDRAILKGILVMTEGLQLDAIAEGVESVAHGKALMQLGCTLAQGYGIAHPMTPDAVPEWTAAFERAPPWGSRRRSRRTASMATLPSVSIDNNHG